MTEDLHLKRSLGLTDVVFFFVITGSNLQWIAAAAAAGASSLAVWVIGAFAMFLPLSICVVYLSSLHPDEGGLYVWSKRAFGPLGGFLTGWTYWASNLPYFPALLYFAAANLLFIDGKGHAASSQAPLFFIAFSLGGLLLGTILNIFGFDVGKWLNNIGAASRWAILLVMIGLGVWAWHAFGPATAMNAMTLRPGFSVKNVIFWSVIAFAWTGPEAVTFIAGEVKNPRRNIPFGLAFSAPVTASIYILGTASVLAIMLPGDVDSNAGVMQAISRAAGRFGWEFITPVAAVLVAISCLGSLGAWLGAMARIPFVAGIDDYLPKIFGHMHPRWGSPIAALVAQSVIAAGFILLGQGGMSVKAAYDVLVSTTVVITLLPFVYLFLSAIKLRHEPDRTDIVRIPGGRTTVTIAAIVGLLTTLVSIVLAVVPSDDETNKVLSVVKILGLTALVLAGGLLIYRSGLRRQADAQRAGPAAT